MKAPANHWLESISHKSKIIAGTCTAALLATASAAEKEAAKAPTDTRISNALETALLFETSVPSHRIDVTISEGIATLEGEVNNLLAKERAVKTAQAVRGVRSVVDKIKIDVETRKDADLADDVRSALLSDPAADSYEVNVEVRDGGVTLSGMVNSWREAELSAHVAKGVRGVKSITNDLGYDYGEDRIDSEILAEVKRAIQIDVLLSSLLIDAEVTDGNVKLAGTVGSIGEMKRATAAAWVHGVNKVSTEDLTVDSWASSDMMKNELPAIKSDEEIKKAVEDSFLYDPRVFSFNPEVTVDQGVVTLSGKVDNLKAKHAAELDARNTVGVWNVKNLLKVRTPKPIPDKTIEDNLNAALAWNSVTESHEIDTEVDSGLVTLNGTVDSYLERSEAEDVANRTNGILLVRNNLKVDYPDLTHYSYSYDPLWNQSSYYTYNTTGETTRPDRSDAEIIEQVEDEFFWSPFVDGEDINITAKKGEVTLNGTVEDYSEYRAATENAYEGGAREVLNNLTIK